MQRRKNKTVSEPKTNMRALLSFRVPINITRVNKPHIKKKAAIAPSEVAVPMPILGKRSKPTSSNQNEPYEMKAVVAKVLPFFPLHYSGDDLSDSAVKDTHGQNHRVQGIKTSVMNIKQDGSHTEAH